MIKVYNAKHKLIGVYHTIYEACKRNKIGSNTVYQHFLRYPDEMSYGVFTGRRSRGDLKFIIVRSEQE